MKEPTLILCHLVLLSTLLYGCLSIPAGTTLRDILTGAFPTFAPNSPNNVAESARWQASAEDEFSKRGTVKAQQKDFNKLMLDIESALQYLEGEGGQDSELFNKRLRRPTLGRRQHNFIRIGKRSKTRRRCTEICYGKREMRLQNDIPAEGFGRAKDPYVLNERTGNGLSPMDALIQRSEESFIDNLIELYNLDSLQKQNIGQPSKRRIHRFVRFGRGSESDFGSNSASSRFDEVPNASPALKRGRLHMFVRFGRSIRRPFQRGLQQNKKELSVGTQDVPNTALSSTPSLDIRETV